MLLPAELTHRQAAVCRNMLVQALTSQSDTLVVADASALERFDSSALAVLLECRRQALARGKGFMVRGLPARLRTLAGLYGVAELLPEKA